MPDNIAEKDSFSVDLTCGCLAEGEYTLISEGKVDEFTLKQYTLDVYGHVMDQMRKDSADRMQKFYNSLGG